MFEITQKADFRGASVGLSLEGVCSRFMARIKGYGIFDITQLNNLAGELNTAAGDDVIFFCWSDISAPLEPLVSRPQHRPTPLIHQNSITQNPS